MTSLTGQYAPWMTIERGDVDDDPGPSRWSRTRLLATDFWQPRQSFNSVRAAAAGNYVVEGGVYPEAKIL